MNILVCGADALGAYLAAHLTLGGHSVTLLAVEDTSDKGAPSTVTLRSSSGHVTQVPGIKGALSAKDALEGSKFDWIAFTMKAYDTVPAIFALQDALGGIDAPAILCLQHGIGNEESLADAFGSERVVAGVLMTPVETAEEAIVQEGKRRGLVIADDRPAANRMLESFRATDLRVRTVPDSVSLKWSRLLFDLTGNVTAAILDTSPDKIVANRALLAVERAALVETLRIMRASNISPVDLPGAPVRSLARVISWLPAFLLRYVLAAAEHSTTLRYDAARGERRSEVIWLNGAVVRVGESIGVPTPVNHVLALTWMDILEGRASWDQFRNHPAMLLSAVRVAR